MLCKLYVSSTHHILTHLQDKTGTLTQNKMHVVNVAVDDMVFDAPAFSSVATSATPQVASNLSQVVAVGGLCNAAVFNTENNNGSEKAIAGDATGKRSILPCYARQSYSKS